MIIKKLYRKTCGNRIIKIIVIIIIITFTLYFRNVSIANSNEEIIFKDVISTYSTSYSESSINRTTNICIAANKINNTVINPGEIFSFNQILGERTKEQRV